MDVKSAFLYGKIKEEVYVCQPPRFEDPNFPDRVYKVEKALYGLHPTPKAWYETLSTYLLHNGFQRGKIDKTLFIIRDKGDILLVQVYVDDIIFGSIKMSLYNAFEKLMHEKFQMSSMGELTFFLGLQVKQKNDGIFISQDKYVAEILKKFGFIEVKTASTPLETQKPLLKDEDGEEVDVHMYRSMIGSLMYLTSSRPGIMFVLCACARYQVNPKVSHLYVVKRIFRYLKGQPKLGLWYPKDSPFDLVAYTDSDYAGASLDRKSTTRGKYQLQALVDGKKIIIIESTVRRDLQLEDAEGVDCLPNATIFEQLTLIGNEVVNKEMDNSLVRAATTASSLEAEQDSGNINKTRSKAILNEPNPQGTGSGSSPRCQETMGDTIAQTRVFDLENTKTAQAQEITSLKSRVKKLEKKGVSRTHKLKRLYKVGRSTRVISFDEASLGDQEDASKQGRKIDDIDKDAEITLVGENQGRYGDEEMFDTVVLDDEEVFAGQDMAKKEVNVAEKEVSLLIQLLLLTLIKIRSAKPKVKEVVIGEQSESTTRTRPQQLPSKDKARKKHFAAMRAQEKRNKPPTKAQKRKTLSTYLKNMVGYKHNQLKNKSFDDIQKLFDKAMKRVNTFVDIDTELVEGSKVRAEGSKTRAEGSSKRAREDLQQESTKKQKVDEDRETAKLKSLIEVIPEEEEVAIDAIPLTTKPASIVD
ncbi:putative ribonuclease H-like domain-containing protein [Tanacetum coccineum]